MFFRRMILIGLLVVLVMASCARRAARFEFEADFDNEISEAIREEFGIANDVTVIERVGNSVVNEYTVAFDDLDELDYDHLDFDADDITVNFDDDGLAFELRGEGDVVGISAEFNSNSSTIEIERRGEGR